MRGRFSNRPYAIPNWLLATDYWLLEEGTMGILWIILIVVLVLALLGFFARGF